MTFKSIPWLIVSSVAGLAVLVSALVFCSSLCPADASAPVNVRLGPAQAMS